jgi:carboxyl-terminal processing protease
MTGLVGIAFGAWLTLAGAAPARNGVPSGLLDTLWSTVRDSLYDADISRRCFTDSARRWLEAEAGRAGDSGGIARAFDTFLATLHVSHTWLYTPADVEYSLYASTGLPDIEEPRAWQIGAQFAEHGDRTVVRCVWDGAPAARAGLRRGDVVLAADGRPFHPLNSFREGRRSLLHVQRGGRSRFVPVTPVLRSSHALLVDAITLSLRWLDAGGLRVGYVHLWTGTSRAAREAYVHAVLDSLAGAEGLILDLRDGFGGAWYDYLDPFFADRRDYFRATVRARGRAASLDTAAAIQPHRWYAGPLLVLVNEGTRSGKEAMAFQFAKVGRGELIGVTTAGAVAGGLTLFFAPNREYLLYVAWRGLALDGQTIEGRGVPPDRRVEYPLEAAPDHDPQLDAALAEMRRRLGSH